MNAPKKPKKPKKATDPVPCECHGGRVKQWDEGPYSEYVWVTCHVCKGTCVVTPEVQDEILARTYERDLKCWNVAAARHRILSKIDLTDEQMHAINQYGFSKFWTDYVSKKGKPCPTSST